MTVLIFDDFFAPARSTYPFPPSVMKLFPISFVCAASLSAMLARHTRPGGQMGISWYPMRSEIWKLNARAVEMVLEAKMMENERTCMEFIEDGLRIQRLLPEDVIQVLVSAKIKIALRRAMNPQIFQVCTAPLYEEFAPVMEEIDRLQDPRQDVTSLFSRTANIPRRTEEGTGQPTGPENENDMEEKMESSVVHLGNAGSIPQDPISYPVVEPVRRTRSPVSPVRNDLGYIIVDLSGMPDIENNLTVVVPDFDVISKRIWYDLWEMDCEDVVKDVSTHVIVLLIAMLLTCISSF